MSVFKKKEKILEVQKEKQEAEAKDTGFHKSDLPEEVRKSFLEDIIVAPRITEKATEEAEKNVYVFEVAKYANKPLIKQAMRYLYGVEPEKINIVNQQPREVTRLGRKGKKKGVKKAYVYLKKGEKIEVV